MVERMSYAISLSISRVPRWVRFFVFHEPVVNEDNASGSDQ